MGQESKLSLAHKLKTYIPDWVWSVADPFAGQGELLGVFGDDIEKVAGDFDEDALKAVRKKIRSSRTVNADAFSRWPGRCGVTQAVVTDIPFGVRTWAHREQIARFIVPELADWLFVEYAFSWVERGGIAAIHCPLDMMRKGGADRRIRERMVRDGHVDTVEYVGGQYGPIKACILVLTKKGRSKAVRMKWGASERIVPLSEIRDNGYSLNPMQYMSSEDALKEGEKNMENKTIEIKENATNLCPPRIELARRIEAFFRKDDDVTVDYDDGYDIDIYVDGTAKAAAMERVMPRSVTLGNETVNINIIPNNKGQSIGDVYRDLLAGNRAVGYICTSEGPVMEGSTYVVFEPEVVQYRNDDLGDFNGIHSTLYQYLADKIFKGGHDGVFFCTAVADTKE